MNKNDQRRIKFQENRQIASVLQRGDRSLIAKQTGYANLTIRDILSGYRRMPDSVKIAIIKLVDQRREINDTLNKISVSEK